MARKRRKRQDTGGDSTAQVERQPQKHDGDPVVRLVALDPSSGRVAVAVGPSLRVLDPSTGEPCFTEQAHTAPIRALCFSRDGALLMTASDDKSARILETGTWCCVTSFRAAKRICAATFSSDGAYAFAADKFGDVHAVVSRPEGTAGAAKTAAATSPAAAAMPAAPGAGAGSGGGGGGRQQQPALLLGHLCSIISSLTALPQGGLLVSTDKESKVRVSILPPQPLKGAWEIECYCLGHTSFVTSSAALVTPDARQLLVTAGGDGTVRVWDPSSGGAQLCCYVASPEREAPAADAPGGAAAGGDEAVRGDAEGAGASGVATPPEGALALGSAAEAAGAGEPEAAGEAEEGGEEGGEERGEEGGEEGEDGGDEDAGASGGGFQGGRGADAGCSINHRHTCAPVLAVAASPDGCLVATLVEGDREVQILRFDSSSNHLSCQQRLPLEGVAAPCHVAFDAQQRLWVVGAPAVPSSEALHLSVAAPINGDAGAPYAWVTGEVLSEVALAFLERRGDEDAGAPQEGQAPPAVHYTAVLRKRTYNEIGPRPRKHKGTKRSHCDETARLEALAAKFDLEQQRRHADGGMGQGADGA